METIFYCTPADLLSLFQEIERTIPLTYTPRKSSAFSPRRRIFSPSSAIWRPTPP